jgi:hypothetical protein
MKAYGIPWMNGSIDYQSKTIKLETCIVSAPLKCDPFTPQAKTNHFTPSDPSTRTSLGGESIREALHVVLKVALVGQELDISTIDLDAASSLSIEVLLTAERSKAPVLGDNDLLATGELVLGAAESLEGDGAVWNYWSAFAETAVTA